MAAWECSCASFPLYYNFVTMAHIPPSIGPRRMPDTRTTHVFQLANGVIVSSVFTAGPIALHFRIASHPQSSYRAWSGNQRSEFIAGANRGIYALSPGCIIYTRKVVQ